MAETRTEDEYGRQEMPIVLNESEDGTGVWHCLTVDSSGNVINASA